MSAIGYTNEMGDWMSRIELWGTVRDAGIAVALLSFAGATTSVAGQTPPVSPRADDTVPVDIVVTARRREESLQNVPIAVTAVVGAEIAARQTSDLQELQGLTPNLNIATYPGDPSSVSIQMRGQVQADLVATNDPAVGVYIDGVYMGRGNAGSLNLIDVERVEVLRGPQGTLFGRNTTGGAINIVPKSPTQDFGGWVSGRAGNFDLLEFSGMVNIPVGETAAVRIVGQHTQNDGYVRSQRTGQRLLDNNSEALRGIFKWQPIEDLSVQLSADYSDHNNNGTAFKLLAINPASAANLLPVLQPAADGGRTLASYIGGNRFTIDSGRTDNAFHSKLWGTSATISYDLGALQLKSISAYRALKREAAFDYDGTPYILLEGDAVALNQHQFSQEFQLNGSALENRLQYTAGLFYFREKADDSTANDALIGLAPAPFSRGITDGTATNSSYAVYGQATYEIFSNTRITAGLRYTEDKREFVNRNHSLKSAIYDGPVTADVCSIALTVRDDPSVCSASFEDKSHYTSYTISIDHKFDDMLVYARTGRSFKAGGFNNRASTAPESFLPFKPEKLTDYEIGVKADWLDRRLRTNLAVFYSDYRNMQRTLTVSTPLGPTPTANFTRNAKKAHITGFEAEVRAIPTSGLSFNFGLGYLRPVYDDYHDIAPPFVDRSGEPFIYVSKWTVSAAAHYEFATAAGNWALNGSYSLRSEFYFQPADSRPQADYGIANASIGLTPAALPNLTVQAWIKNAFDEGYFSNITDLLTTVGFAAGTPGEPRTYGLSATYRF
jgi:iron complex outermembrane receptor protein